MKRPNNLFQKKYISSLVIAAFLILSVLTAYNIKIGKEAPEASGTENVETVGESDDVIGPVSEYTQDGDGDDTDDDGANNDMDSYGTEDEADDDTDDDDDSDEADDDDDSDDTDDDGDNGEADDDDDSDEADDDDDSDNTEDSTKNTTKKKKNASDSSSSETYTYDGKTKLSWPVVGNIILPYSMDSTVYYTTLDQYACCDGIVIGAKKGDKVKAPADGRVVNVYESDKYGKSVTIFLGSYYEVTCAQLDDINFEIGDDVSEGDVIGTVAEPTRSFILEGPNVFFKMTHKGKTVNPVKYLRS